jgi:hypothetical protein
MIVIPRRDVSIDPATMAAISERDALRQTAMR